MTWDANRTAEILRSYRLGLGLSGGDRASKQLAESEHSWARDAVHDAVDRGDLPLTVLDAMLHDPEGDESYRGYVAAGPIEDLLADHQEAYAGAIAERCRTDPLWAQAVAGIWLDRDWWLSLPEELRRLIPEPIVVVPEHPTRRAKRPSKRQGNRPRHP